MHTYIHTLSLHQTKPQHARIKSNMGAKNFGKKKDSAKVKRAKRREKKLKALRFAGINVDKEKDNGETMMTDNEKEVPDVSLLSKKEKRARDMQRKKELKLAMKSMKEQRRKEEKKTGTVRKTLSRNIQKMKKERDELVSKKKKKKDDESGFGTGVGEMNDVEMTTT